MMKKCSRCGVYFQNHDERVCFFHHGPWIDVHVPGKGSERIGVWSCCKEVTRSAVGCVSSPHLEDKETTEALRNFEVFAVRGTREQALELLDTEFIRKNMASPNIHMVTPDGASPVRVDPSAFSKTYWGAYVAAQEDAHVVGYASKPLPNQVPMRVFKRNKEEPPTPEGFDKYTIKPTDTLQGIALRFNCKVAALKQLNKLYSDNDLFKVKTLLIPREPPEPSFSRPLTPAASLDTFTRAWHITKLSVAKSVCPEEALFYLSDNDWNFNNAISSMEADMEWAEEQFRKQKGKVLQFLGDTDVQTVAVVACGAIIVLLCIVL